MFQFRGKRIPERMMPDIERYVKHGEIPGDFLQAVICNDLQEAVAIADDESLDSLPAYAKYFYNEVPSPAWGSHEKMIAWADNGGLLGWEG